ncbi:amino acid ABC transporter ATP-binding protein [Terrilactibacillus laevilacticus]|uniref:amino acid ABC transporter ATP-binding protein n=1 Tax=Terrilactibacillus laevilacticus TaxID=1380157 RepID=UPI001147681B|nr:amino acid ABC transporter ATP-binding protein [Terrilactibacillus laevilacticus]
MIKVENINKFYGDKQILKNISLEVSEGEVISIIGPSGAGKSTFLRCLNLLEVPSNGVIKIDGKNVQYKANAQGKLTLLYRLRLSWLRIKVGMVFQQFNLWSHKTVLQNIIEGPINVKGVSSQEAKTKAEILLKKIGLEDKINEYPENLSGGQKQRVAIARALAMEPSVILFDEPTSALDPELVNEVLAMMKSLAQEGMTMIIVTHEINFAREISDRILFMEKGEVTKEGSPQELFSNPDPRLKQFINRITHTEIKEGV